MTAVFHILPIHHDTYLVIVILYRAKGQMKWNFQIICFQKRYSASKLNPLWRSTSTLVESTVFCRQTRRWVYWLSNVAVIVCVPKSKPQVFTEFYLILIFSVDRLGYFTDSVKVFITSSDTYYRYYSSINDFTIGFFWMD